MTRTPAPKRAVRAAFDKAAGHYDAVASVQRTACDHLLALVSSQDFSPDRILDAGCGTGYALAGLKRSFPAADPLAELVKIDPKSIGVGQYQHDVSQPELARSLRPSGQLWLATLGPGTLGELREAFLHVDNNEHVLNFQPPEAIIKAAESAGLRVLNSERRTLHAWAPDLRNLLSDIKTLGAHQTGAAHRPPLGKSAWLRLVAAYEAYRGPNGLPASYDTFWLIAEKI